MTSCCEEATQSMVSVAYFEARLVAYVAFSESGLVSFFFLGRVSLCHQTPGWSAVAQSRLTATSASRVQAILLPQPPKYLGLQAYATMPS